MSNWVGALSIALGNDPVKDPISRAHEERQIPIAPRPEINEGKRRWKFCAQTGAAQSPRQSSPRGPVFKANLMASTSAFAIANATALFHGLYDINRDRYFA